VLAPGNCQYSSGVDVATNLSDKARRFKVDGAIFNNNFGCKTGAGYGPIIKDELMRQVNVPTLTLDCDVIDHTFISRAEVDSQMGSFFEMVENSKAYKERRAVPQSGRALSPKAPSFGRGEAAPKPEGLQPTAEMNKTAKPAKKGRI
jgi:hypothetical protein